MQNLSFRDIILQDFWVHLAGLIAIAMGASDLAYFHTLARDSDLLFVIGGFGAMGLKIVNGSAAQLRQVALDTAFTAARTAQAAAQVAAASAPAVAAAVIASPPITPAAPEVKP